MQTGLAHVLCVKCLLLLTNMGRGEQSHTQVVASFLLRWLSQTDDALFVTNEVWVISFWPAV
jgi:hypothetical protein